MWESLGLKLDHTEEVESEGVTTAHIIWLRNFWEIRQLVNLFPGIHHLALEVDDIEESLAKAKEIGQNLWRSSSSWCR